MFKHWANNPERIATCVTISGKGKDCVDGEIIHQHTYREQKEEMENAIRILKMTDEEVVNTSTYNAVARYL